MIVDWAVYEQGERIAERPPLDAVVATVRGRPDAFAWIGLYEPTDEEFDEVREAFGLHPLAVEDAVNAHQRPKLERYGDDVFVVLRTARYLDPMEVVDLGEIMLFIGAGYVVTVRHGEIGALGNVRRRLEDDHEMLALGPGAVLYAIADLVVDEYAAVTAGLDRDVDEIEDAVFSGQRHDHAERIYKLKREVQDFRRAVRPLAEPLELLAAGRIRGIDAGLAHYFRDVADHVVRVADHVVGLEDLLGSVLNANIAQISLRQNEDMRRISAWVAIAALPTALAAIYGMNFRHMPELEVRWGYPVVLVVMALGCLTLYRAFKRSGWL